MARFNSNRFSLRFDNPEEEHNFLDAYGHYILPQIKNALWIGILLYFLFFLWDRFLIKDEAVLQNLFSVRLSIFLLGLLLLFLLRKIKPNHVFFASLGATVIASCGIGSFIFFTESVGTDTVNAYYPGFMLVIIYGQIALRTLFRHTLLICLLIILFFSLYPISEPHDSFRLNYKILIFSTMVVGAYGNYWLEFYSRAYYIVDSRQKIGIFTTLEDIEDNYLSKRARSFKESLVSTLEEVLQGKNPEKITVEMVAEEMNYYNKKNLERDVAKYLNTSPKKFINAYYLKKALEAYRILKDKLAVIQQVPYFLGDFRKKTLWAAIKERFGD